MFTVDKNTGWMQEVEHCLSPNHDEFPAGAEPDLVVVHNISLPPADFGGPWIKELFMNRLDPAAHRYFSGIASLQVSAHLLIRRCGQVIQFVPFNKRAWHAGVSSFRGRECCNDFSLGIELEGADDIAFTEIQYETLDQVLKSLFASYLSLSKRQVVGHSDIAPGRKTDPGEKFSWSRVKRSLVSD